MKYFQNTTDASQLYRTTSAAEEAVFESTAVRGNLSDLIRNATIIRGTVVAPIVVQTNKLLGEQISEE